MRLLKRLYALDGAARSLAVYKIGNFSLDEGDRVSASHQIVA